MRSDLSAFHRLDDWRDAPAARFFELVELLPHYRGALRARVQREIVEAELGAPEPSRPRERAQRVSDSVALADLAASGMGAWKRG